MKLGEPHNALQAMFDGLSAGWQRERAETQMTLGKLIKLLESLEPNRPIAGLGSLDSYRGFYDDLAFEPDDKQETVGEVLQRCRDAMGRVFEGYKGGDYMMGELTPLWVASYGCCGDRLIDLDAIGEVVKPVTAPWEG